MNDDDESEEDEDPEIFLARQMEIYRQKKLLELKKKKLAKNKKEESIRENIQKVREERLEILKFKQRDPVEGKEKRAHFNDEERDFLHSMFEKNPYPTDYQHKDMAEALGKTYLKITNWFKNERARRGITNQKKILKRKLEENAPLNLPRSQTV